LQDKRLREAVRLHKAEGWKKVAEVVGDGMTTLRCKSRWLDVLQFDGTVEVGKRWTVSEV